MNPLQVQNLVAKAFVLEVMADKPGCTTRFIDLPGKPMEDFVLAGINSAAFFRVFAKSRSNGSEALYEQFIPALKASNQHKSAKYINLGLLEIMFNAVAARLECDEPDSVVRAINKILKEAPASDVKALISARELGWSTSKNAQKKQILEDMRSAKAKDPYEFKEWLVKSTPPDSASYQWGFQALNGWPILQKFFDGLRSNDQSLLLDKIAEVYKRVAADNADIKVGILADMMAAAIFLYLSFAE